MQSSAGSVSNLSSISGAPAQQGSVLHVPGQNSSEISTLNNIQQSAMNNMNGQTLAQDARTQTGMAFATASASSSSSSSSTFAVPASLLACL